MDLQRKKGLRRVWSRGKPWLGGERGRGLWEKEAQMAAQRPLRRKESRTDCQERAKCQEKGRDSGEPVKGGQWPHTHVWETRPGACFRNSEMGLNNNTVPTSLPTPSPTGYFSRKVTRPSCFNTGYFWCQMKSQHLSVHRIWYLHFKIPMV